MPSPLVNIPTYLLASIALLGAFSRFTHGTYTPQWYAFQEYHMKDDGSLNAKIVPTIDLIFGLTLLFGGRNARLLVASLSLGFFIMGTVGQVTNGKDYMADLALVGTAFIAVLSLNRKP
jgi:hypothetical protein